MVILEKFDAERILEVIEQYKVTITQMVPTMFVRLLQLPPEQRNAHDTSSLRLVVHAAAPCPPDVKQAMIDWWGTDSRGVLQCHREPRHHHHHDAGMAHQAGIGGQVGHGPVHVCDDDGNELPPGEVG